MNHSQFDGPGGNRAALDAVVAIMTREMSRLPRTAEGDVTDSLGDAWKQLLALLAAEPAPETRSCPVCRAVCMLAATRCGHCWSSLTPPSPAVRLADAQVFTA